MSPCVQVHVPGLVELDAVSGEAVEAGLTLVHCSAHPEPFLT